MNNKKLGTEFERDVAKAFKEAGWWVHFITPDNRGAQPFDVIAVKNDEVIIGDCKTSSTKRFNINRLEDNQINAFDYWMRCGNNTPALFVRYLNDVFAVDYTVLKEQGSVDLYECLKVGEYHDGSIVPSKVTD